MQGSSNLTQREPTFIRHNKELERFNFKLQYPLSDFEKRWVLVDCVRVLHSHKSLPPPRLCCFPWIPCHQSNPRKGYRTQPTTHHRPSPFLVSLPISWRIFTYSVRPSSSWTTWDPDADQVHIRMWVSFKSRTAHAADSLSHSEACRMIKHHSSSTPNLPLLRLNHRYPSGPP